MARLLGIDCGGTSSSAVLMADGSQVWSGKGGPANLASTAEALSNLRTALEGCPEADSVCAGFAGLVTEVQRAAAEGLLCELFPKAAVKAVADFEAALVASGDVDVCVIAGTGSLVCSWAGDGSIVRSGGRGYVLGDEGSCFQYGRDALLHFLDAPPDEVPERLRNAVTDLFGSMNKGTIIERLYTGNIASDLASLCLVLGQDAEDERVYALKSIRVNSAKLAHVVSIHLRRFLPEIKSATIGCQGGLWSGVAFREVFEEQLPKWCRTDSVKAIFDLPTPVHGAVKIAEGLL